MDSPEPFSTELEEWIDTDREKTLGDLQDVFEERTFAVAIVVLMTPTALPLPTGGVTVVLEAATILVALEMVAGLETVWLPRSWRSRRLGGVITDRAVPLLLRVIRWCERWSRPRGARLFEHRWALRIFGLLIGVLATVSMLAPPFSGLDTLPSLGVVLLALAILLQDLAVAAAGLGVGTAGVLLVVALGAALFRAVSSWW